MTLPSDTAVLVTIGIVVYVWVRAYLNDASKLPLPPGPRRLPIIGNLLDMPKRFEWMTYFRWGQKFESDIIHVDLAGQSVIIVNSAEAANDLFEKRSSIYSSRARLPMVNELMGWSFNFGFMPYGDSWRKHRRLFHQEFNPAATVRYQPQVHKAAHALLRRILEEPDAFLEHFRHMAGAIIMSVAYGLEVKAKDDAFIAAAKGAVHPATLAMVPGTFLVDAFPFLKYMPSWIPGADFKRKAKKWKQLAEIMWRMPFEAGKYQIRNGDAPESFLSFCLEKVNEFGDVEAQEQIIQNTAAAMYIAGSDTPVSALGTFVLAMLVNPNAQETAQAEIDRVVGTGQLPDFRHEMSLPYVTAIMKEVLRWRPVTPIAVPHSCTMEDEYKGYRIPSGSIVIPNSWAMLHDENDYPDPFAFRPERFLNDDGSLNPNVKDPATAAFGFGRRICPGRYMAMSSLWISIASILAVFNISKAKDTRGRTIEPSHEYISSMVCIPAPFKCSIWPRNLESVNAVLSARI